MITYTYNTHTSDLSVLTSNIRNIIGVQLINSTSGEETILEFEDNLTGQQKDMLNQLMANPDCDKLPPKALDESEFFFADPQFDTQILENGLSIKVKVYNVDGGHLIRTSKLLGPAETAILRTNLGTLLTTV